MIIVVLNLLKDSVLTLLSSANKEAAEKGGQIITL